jgi:hypothetical protein
MRRILLALAAAAALWALWWPLIAWRSTATTEAWLEARRDAGWQAEWDTVSVSGFPLAYVRRIGAPALADPGTGWAWRAEEVTLARARHPALAQPGLVVSFPAEQEVRTPWQRLTVTGAPLQAELMLEGAEARLGGATLEARALEIASDAGWRMALASGRLTALAAEAAPEVVTLTLSAADLALPQGTARALRGADLAPDTMQRLEAEAEVTFDRAWDLRALEERRPQPRRIVVEDAALRWGALELRVAGTLEVGPEGSPKGKLLVKATNWRDILAAARLTGALPEGIADALEGALGLASRLAGSPRTLDLPLVFADGRTRLGPVPVGPAPRLTLP